MLLAQPPTILRGTKMTPPSGPIVARPMLTRACGCVKEFQHYSVDKFRAQRQAKFQATRCPECAGKVIEGQRLPSKGEAFGRLPAGAKMTLICQADGTWSGTMDAAGVQVEASAKGPQGVTAALAQEWVRRQPATAAES